MEVLSGRSARGVAQRAVDLLDVLEPERPELDAVAGVLRAHGEQEPLGLSAADLPALRTAASRVRSIFSAPDVDAAARRLNELLAAHAHPPRLTTHGGAYPWHLHVDAADDGPWGQWLLTSSCLALAVLLADRQRLPGGLCAAPTCRKPFVDTGNGSPRRFCSTRCATRQRVAAHRGAKRG